MRRFSHILSFLTVALFLLSIGSTAKANVVDPQIGLGGGGSTLMTTQSACTISISDESCTFAVDANGNGIADITNDLGATIVSDTVNVSSAFVGGLTCAIDPENSFGFNSAVAAGTTCTFSEVPIGLFSILNGQLYGLHFSGFCPDGGCSSDPNNPTFLTFALRAITEPSPVPEPSTILLLGTGLVTLIANRNRLKAAKHLV